MAADQNGITAKRRVPENRARLSRRHPPFSPGMSTDQFRQHDCSDDADHQAVAWMSPRDRRREFPCFTTRGRSLSQREMSAILEIVEDVFVHQAFKMPPIENDHMVEQIPAAGAYPAFRNAVLPWTAEVCSLGLNFIIELRAAIKDQVARGRIIGKRLAQLLHDKCTRRMGSHLALKNTLVVMRDDEKAVEHSEAQRWHSKEIHRGDGFPMIAQKGLFLAKMSSG